MGGLVNLIKKLFSGIFSLIGGLLRRKKSDSGYYLELNEAESGKAADAPKSVETKAPKTDKAAPKTDKAAPKADKAAPVAAAVAIAAPAVDTASLNGSKPATANPLNLPQPTVSSFAPEYLTPKPTAGRRRPGANMSSFLEMAKTVKTSN
jgi:hypothetical protein